MNSENVHIFTPSNVGSSKTLLVLHGTGGDETSLLPLARHIAPDYNYLSLRGNVLENGARRFFRRFAEGVFDYEDIETRSHQLAHFVDEAAAEYGFERSQVTAMGYSNGANIAWSMLLLHPDVLNGGILFRPMVTLEGPKPDLRGKCFFVSAGQHDPIVPVENTERLTLQMEALGASVELNWHGGGHELGRQELNRAKEWLIET